MRSLKRRSRRDLTVAEQAWINRALEVVASSDHPAALAWRHAARAAQHRADRLSGPHGADLIAHLTLDDWETLYEWFAVVAETDKPPRRIRRELVILAMTR